MTDDSAPEDDVIGSTEPIDADFEPAPEDSSGTGRRASGGPGWLGALVLSLFAAGLGGILGMAGTRFIADTSTNPGAVGARIDALQAEQEDISIRLARALREQGGLDAGLDTLAEQVEALSAREPSGSGADPSVVEDLRRRIAALESIDPSGEVSPEDLSRAVASLESRLDRLAGSVEALQEAPEGVAVERVIEIETRLAELRDDLSQAKLSSSRDAEKLAGLIEGMRQDEADARGAAAAASQTADLARAVSAIEAASRRGGGFAPELRTLRTLMPNDPSVRQLGPIAETGAPGMAELQAAFATARAEARTVLDARPANGLGWLNRTFGDAVSVRRADGQDDDPSALLDRAGEAMDAGNLGLALELTGQLDGAPADAMSGWTELANRRITLEAALEALHGRLLEGNP
ncbi:hypothetical protein [Hyphomonas sp.]|uniref:COG4223 family protein n=1 Tax=Hyphomonas sp. TaxID=87 RepID=UPI0025BF7C3D|nr:hypothetical protein [Hyphomonas sp.]